MSAREEILDRIRQALGPGQPAEVAAIERNYRRVGTRSPDDLLDLLNERLLEYRSRVRRCSADEVGQTVAAALTDRGATRILVPTGLDVPLPAGIEVVEDDGQLSASELDSVDGVVTRASVAVAETGTVVLDGSRGQGRRAISLVPDYHLCLVYSEQVVETVPEAVALLQPDRPLTWISGPSATSDIELDRVEGVHGPRTLEIILAGGRRT